MKKQFWVTFLAILVALCVFSMWSNYAKTHMLVKNSLDQYGRFEISQVWSPVSGPSDDYVLYVYPVIFTTDGESWDTGVVGDLLYGPDVWENDESNHGATIDGNAGVNTIYVAVCAPAGLKTVEEVDQYGWNQINLEGHFDDHRGPRNNNMGFSFFDDGSTGYTMLKCGK